MVRAIAADATWRRIFTDPATGEVTGTGARTYRPGADLTRTVVARDVTCTFPGCRIAAWRCDLDHLQPFDHNRPDQDQTVPENLHALCRHHHRLKTHTPWQVTRDPVTGATGWTAPTGHHYRRRSVPADPHHAADPAPGSARAPDHAAGAAPAPVLGSTPQRPSPPLPPDLGPPPF